MKGCNSGSTMKRNLRLARLSTVYFPSWAWEWKDGDKEGSGEAQEVDVTTKQFQQRVEKVSKHTHLLNHYVDVKADKRE
jgi:hypothetical protein